MPSTPLARALLLLFVVFVPLSGCGMFSEPELEFVANQPRETSVDPAAAAAKINAYRAGRGVAPLAVDPSLNAIARRTARELANRDQLRTELHSKGGLLGRLENAGYAHVAAAENLGSGYPTLDLAIEGWKRSRGHDRNLLNEDMMRMGIGLALTPRGKFHSYWVLILARPDDRRA